MLLSGDAAIAQDADCVDAEFGDMEDGSDVKKLPQNHWYLFPEFSRIFQGGLARRRETVTHPPSLCAHHRQALYQGHIHLDARKR